MAILKLLWWAYLLWTLCIAAVLTHTQLIAAIQGILARSRTKPDIEKVILRLKAIVLLGGAFIVRFAFCHICKAISGAYREMATHVSNTVSAATAPADDDTDDEENCNCDASNSGAEELAVG